MFKPGDKVKRIAEYCGPNSHPFLMSEAVWTVLEVRDGDELFLKEFPTKSWSAARFVLVDGIPVDTGPKRERITKSKHRTVRYVC